MPTAINEGIDIVYDVSGPAEAPTVALVEGLGYGRWMWRWQREALAEKYRVIVPDNRGTGDSDAPEGPYSIREMAADLEAVLADADAAEAHLVGASMGGMIAQRYALEFDRAASLSLLCTSPGGPDSVPVPEETRERIFDVPEGADERETIKRRMAPAVSEKLYEEHPGTVERIVDWRLTQDASEAAREAQAAAVAAFDASAELDSLEVPALVLHGTDDRVVPVENARLLHGKLPDSRLDLYEGGPHLFFVEDPDWVNERLDEFLARRTDGGA